VPSSTEPSGDERADRVERLGDDQVRSPCDGLRDALLDSQVDTGAAEDLTDGRGCGMDCGWPRAANIGSWRATPVRWAA